MALFVVATPIGNLQDITQNALDVLAKSSLILCENTITTSNLLKKYNIIGKRTVNYTDHTKEEEVVKHLEFANSNAVSIVSEAGTPCISDPGYKIIKMAHEMGIKVHPIAGSSSLISAISVCGLPSNHFAFLGFYNKESIKKAYPLLKNGLTIAFFVPARDLLEVLTTLKDGLDIGKICVARELTKIFEDIKTGTPAQLINYYQIKEKLKGEAVLILSPPQNIQENKDILPILIKILEKKPFLKNLKAKECSEILKEYEEELKPFSKKEIYNKLNTINKPQTTTQNT